MVEENAENTTSKAEDETIIVDDDTPAPEKEPDEWEDILGSGSIMKKIIQKGTSESRPQRLQVCQINYESKLENGILIEKCDNFTMQLGDCDVISISIDIVMFYNSF